MRIARKLMLLALTAMAAMAFAASSASALDKVEVVNEKTGAHCTAATCTVHAVGSATLRIDLGIFGEAHEASCGLEVVMTLTETGDGSVTKVSKTPGDANCTNDSSSVVVECSLPWKGSGEEDGPVGVVQSQVAVCLNPAESGSDCVGNLAFSIVEQAGEHYETQFNNASVQLCELDVDLEVESTVASNAAPHVNHP